MNHSTVQLSCQMADDLSRRSRRLGALREGSLQKYCEVWVDTFQKEYDWYHSQFGADSPDWDSEDRTKTHVMSHANDAVKEAMPLWLWFTIGQILLKLIWEWWQKRQDEEVVA